MKIFALLKSSNFGKKTHYVHGIITIPKGFDVVTVVFISDCDNDDLELVLFVHQKDFVDHNSMIRQLADQFNNRGAIVRVLKYRVLKMTLPIDETILSVQDIEIGHDYDKDKNYACPYRLRVSDFFKSLKLSNAKSRGIIIITNAKQTFSVTEHILLKTTKPNLEVFRVTIGPMIRKLGWIRYRYTTDIIINRFDLLSTLGSKIFSKLCKSKFTCMRTQYVLCNAMNIVNLIFPCF